MVTVSWCFDLWRSDFLQVQREDYNPLPASDASMRTQILDIKKSIFLLCKVIFFKQNGLYVINSSFR